MTVGAGDRGGPQPAAELIVAEDIATECVRRFLDASPRTLALSGGRTPRPVYERLAALNYPWNETRIFFGDERCVPPDDPASNYRMAFEALLSRVPAEVHRMRGETCDASQYEEDLRRTFGPGVPSFDLALLGLGEDGHTASLFPGDPALQEHERLAVRVERPDHPRLTLTLPVLSAAKLVIFLVSGADKRDALTKLLAGDTTIPAARVHAARVLVIADAAAAGRRA
jgi:6-phosphogluconolactonase